MRRRTFIQNLAAGGAGLSVALKARAFATPAEAGLADFPPLQRFEFDTVSVDRTGRTVAVSRHQGRYFTQAIDDDVSFDMIAIPAEATAARTAAGPSPNAISRPIYLARTTVTQAQWRAVARLPRQQRDLDAAPSCFVNDEHPVECISWYEAEEFCARLAAHTRRAYRLPSEAEWENACRAGSRDPFHYGGTLTSELANYGAAQTYAAESPGCCRRSTTPVAQFAPNRHGLHDMHGNVWEWCADTWQAGNRDAGSPSRQPARPDWRVLRGGSWADAPARLRSASRTGNRADALNRIIGLRVALSLAPA